MSMQGAAKKREAFIAVTETRTDLFVPRGVLQSTACERKAYRIPANRNTTNTPPGVIPL